MDRAKYAELLNVINVSGSYNLNDTSILMLMYSEVFGSYGPIQVDENWGSLLGRDD